METPICDFVRAYAESRPVRMHMPGHKGNPQVGPEALDLTEIEGADVLYRSEGIIRRSEENAAALFGAARTVYSAEGSSLCIRAMLYLALLDAKEKGILPRLLAGRNAHRTLMTAAALLDREVDWLLPAPGEDLLSCAVTADILEKELDKGPYMAVYLTSPDYLGRRADLRAAAEVCRRRRVPLLVDNAHGAYLKFLPEDEHPITLGADACCDSAHKMLPALTGAAVLHTSRREYADKLKQAMSLFGSTSPSYLVMASLDLCNRYIAERIRNDIASAMPRLAELRSALSDRLVFADSEPFHITVRAAESDFCGAELAELLRDNGVECEYADRELVILLMSPFSSESDYVRLRAALESAVSGASPIESEPFDFQPKLPKMALAIREAAFAMAEEIPVDEAEGRICASVKVPCPPAIPIAVSGEIIDRECMELFRAYGIKKVLVVKN